jgi:hypothetical protein
MIEGLSVVLSFLQNCKPAQTRLSAIQDKKLKQSAVIVQWHAPLCIVIFYVERIG